MDLRQSFSLRINSGSLKILKRRLFAILRMRKRKKIVLDIEEFFEGAAAAGSKPLQMEMT